MLKDTFTFQGPLGEIECLVEPNRSNNNAVLVMAHGKCVVELSEEDLMQEGADKHLAEIIGNQKEKALSQEVAQ